MADSVQPSRTIRVLFLEDNEADYIFARQLLMEARPSMRIAAQKYDIVRAEGLTQGLEELRKSKFDVIVLDLSLPDAVGLEGLHTCRSLAPNIPIVVLTGNDDDLLVSEALSHGAQDYLVKGRPGESLGHSIRYAIERQRMLSDLERAKEQALAATEAKGLFLANMSHEIRTPLTAIIGFTETLLQSDMPPSEREEAVNTILKNSNHLLVVINDVLDMSKIEAGNLVVECIPCSPLRILGDIEASMRLKAKQKGLDFQIEFVPPIPPIIQTDPTRLRQILINLVGNAIKFTHHGSVKVNVNWDSISEVMCFQVIDTGIGIHAEDQKQLFKTFSQGDVSITRRYGGTGLGLVLSKKLAEKLGGNISLCSSKGKGSTFTVEIKASKGATVPGSQNILNTHIAEEMKSEFKIPVLQGSVLVAEDGEDNQKLIAYYLNKGGAKVTIVENGALAVERVAQEKFDLILMDLQMPVLDGYRATKQIRADGCTTPIIALTASILKESIQKCIDCGCTEHLSKPFKRGDFFNVVSKYLGQATPEVVRDPENVAAIVEVAGASGGDRDPELFKIFSNFRNKLPARIAEIRNARRAEDRPQIKHLAHKLRSAENFGLPTLSRMATALEEMAMTEENWSKIENLVARMEAICCHADCAITTAEKAKSNSAV